MSSHLDTLLHRLKHGISKVELVHTPHERWPLSPRRSPVDPLLRISVLDSSFNPPTLAHLALASAPPVPVRSSTQSRSARSGYDAKLLLLSVRNADKVLKPGDATYAQRLDMMGLLAKDIASAGETGSAAGMGEKATRSEQSNIAVAIIDEPTFVGKSSTLSEFLRERLASLLSSDCTELDSTGERPPSAPTPSIMRLELAFLMGVDTLERLFDSRYYRSEDDMRRSLNQFVSPEGDNSSIVCARRVMSGSRESEDRKEQKIVAMAKEYLGVHAERVALIDIGERQRTFSSSEVRERIRNADPTWKTMVTPSVAQYVTENHLYEHADTA